MATAMTRSWTISACLSNVDLICREISSWLAEQGLTVQLFPLELLAREALNNAVIHGSKCNPAKQVRCELRCLGDALMLKVEDDGSGFAWHDHLQPDVPKMDRESGRGLQLYRLYSDLVEFNSSGNQIVLIRLLKNEGN